MDNLFLSTVRYDKTMENGLNKTVNEHFLVDALSFTEAEARTINEISAYISGEYSIPKIVKPRISELFLFDDGDRFYKVKVAYITLDENTGAEKSTTHSILVKADDFHEAYDRFIERMKGSLADYEILSIAETSITDYFSAPADGTAKSE